MAPEDQNATAEQLELAIAFPHCSLTASVLLGSAVSVEWYGVQVAVDIPTRLYK